MSEELPADGLDSLASELRQLAPQRSALDRDATMFRAGQASAPRGWLWPAATVVSSGTATLLALVLLFQPPPQTVTVYASDDSPSSEAADSFLAELPSREEVARHRQVQERLLRQGLDGLPTPPASTSAQRPYSSHYSDLLNGESTP